MSSMFCMCHALTSLDLSSFNTSKVTSMYNMFDGYNAYMNLANIYVGSGWSTTAVTDSTDMFRGCAYLPNYGTIVDKTYAYAGGQGYLTAK